MDTTKIRLQAVRSRIADSCLLSHRNARDIVLVAVTKGVRPDLIRSAYEAGQAHFGESYAQEAAEKMAALSDMDAVWHYIGPIQSNKTRSIAERFDWVHTVDRVKVAERLNAQRPADKAPLNICIQVNISGEASKSGVAAADVATLAQAVRGFARLRLRGLMAIPEPTPDPALRLRQFAALADLRADLAAGGLVLDTLSMGMSDDLEEAIAAGSTLLRVGTAIFGPRPSTTNE